MDGYLKKVKSLIPGYTTSLDLGIVIVGVALMLAGLITEHYWIALIGGGALIAFIAKELMNDRR